MKRTVFFISDGTGITAETMGKSLLSHFETLSFAFKTIPYVTAEMADEVKGRINAVQIEDGVRPIVIATIIDKALQQSICSANGFFIDLLSSFLSPLEEELQTPSSHTVGKYHSISEDLNYKIRIDAVNFAQDNDDGGRTRNYGSADIILVGVSRCGKTPTCLYMALQFGVKAANYPITEEDLGELALPRALLEHKHKIYGLTIAAERLCAIRNERLPSSKYSSIHQCQHEIKEAEAMYRRYGIPFIDSTHYSIEEISTRILAAANIERRLH